MISQPLFGLFEESVEVDVAHEQDPNHRGQVGEAPLPFELRFHDGEQQVGDENHPDLNFDGVGAFAVEVAQGEVQLQLLEDGLYLPASLVNGDDVLRTRARIVGQQAYEFCLLLVVIGDYPCPVTYLSAVLACLDKLHLLFPACHHSIG